MTVLALVEPTALVAIFALSVPTGSTSLPTIVGTALDDPQRLISPASLLAAVALAAVIVAETGRLPVDNPSTHLELTMIHEAMVLEYAGPDLALVELGSAMRLSVYLGLFTSLFVPWGSPPPRPRSRWPSVSSRWSSRSGSWAPGLPRSRCSWPSCGCSGCRSCWPGRSCWPCSPSPPPTSSADRTDASGGHTGMEPVVMSPPAAALLDVAAGALLLTAVLVVWRRDLPTILRIFTAHGLALGALVGVLAWAQRSVELGLVTIGVLAVRGGCCRGCCAARSPGRDRPVARSGRWSTSPRRCWPSRRSCCWRSPSRSRSSSSGSRPPRGRSRWRSRWS
ncbi:NADH-quinone oxidoreductase subunit H [Pseudonocardia benzenivorans]